jgi:hypothetical protein
MARTILALLLIYVAFELSIKYILHRLQSLRTPQTSHRIRRLHLIHHIEPFRFL